MREYNEQQAKKTKSIKIKTEEVVLLSRRGKNNNNRLSQRHEVPCTGYHKKSAKSDKNTARRALVRALAFANG